MGGLDQAIQLNIDGVAVKAFFLIGRRPGAALVVSPKAAGLYLQDHRSQGERCWSDGAGVHRAMVSQII